MEQSSILCWHGSVVPLQFQIVFRRSKHSGLKTLNSQSACLAHNVCMYNTQPFILLPVIKLLFQHPCLHQQNMFFNGGQKVGNRMKYRRGIWIGRQKVTFFAMPLLVSVGKKLFLTMCCAVKAKHPLVIAATNQCHMAGLHDHFFATCAHDCEADIKSH